MDLRPTEEYWKSRNNIRKPDTVPLFFDCAYVDAWPNANAGPPQFEGDMSGYNEWAILCMNRHMGYVNYLFADMSQRRVGLKELWTLRWNQRFNIFNAWTKAGGVTFDDWPVWLKPYNDY